jgi:hypothetical protein
MTTTLFPITPTEGVNFNATYTAYNQAAAISATNSPDNPGPPMQVGTVVKGTGDSEFVFILATSTINNGDACIIATAAQSAAALTTGNKLIGNQVGFAQVPIANGSFGWLQRAGACQNINVAAGTTANTVLTTTAAAGVLGAAGGIVTGVVITVTSAGAATVAGTLNFPTITS